MAKRALNLLVIFFSLLVLSTSTVHAQKTWGPNYDASQMEAYRNAVEGDNCSTPSLECLVHQTSRFVAIEWVNSILYPGGPPDVSTLAPGENETSYNSGSNNSSFVGGINTLIGSMYENPAANTSVYIADIMNSAHITPRAYAQGLGFASLNPILELWKAFRNIAYLFFIVIFIVIGFMIMLRKKIGGQTAVTAQQAIPNVIVSLILVTFSYAIAGLLIDFMYVTMFMIIGIFGQTLPGGNENIVDANIFQLVGQLFDVSKETNVVGGISDIVTNLLNSVVANEAVSGVLGVIGGITLSLVIAIAVLIGTFKLFFELLKSYVTVVISVVTAPMVLMMGALPGQNQFTPWIKNIIANLSPFPTVLMVVVLFYQFTSLGTGGTDAGGFIPPFLLGRGQAGAVSTLMGLAIILALPEIVKDVKKKLGASEGFGGMVAKAAGASVKKGWQGGELIPGVAATNTARIPVVGSGRDFLRKGAMATGAVAGGIGNAAYQKYNTEGGSPKRGFGVGLRRGGSWVGSKLGDKNYNLEIEKKRQEKQKKVKEKEEESKKT